MAINLNKKIAPISDLTWNLINERAKEVIVTALSARKVLSIRDLGNRKGVNTGRVALKEKDGIKYGVYQINPLLETRINFTLNRWELDNAEKGVKDIDLSPLEDAVLMAARFEERAIYYGLDEIKGLLDSSTHDKVPFGKTPSEVLAGISKGMTLLNDSYCPCNLDLIVDYDSWILINSLGDHSIGKRIKDMIGGSIVLSESISTPILLPHKNENFEIAISEDFAIGYQSHTDKEVTLFISEDFSYRTLDGSLVIVFEK